jgi:hypothetical protein
MIYAPFIALAIGALWFGPMIARHGWGVLTAGSASRSIDIVENLVALAGGALNPPNLAFTIGAVGIVIAIRQRRWDLLGWLAVTALGAAVVDRWAVVPLAVLAGLAVDTALDAMPSRRAVALVGVAAAVAVTGVLLGERPRSLTADERAIAAWAGTESPTDATFAVIGYRFDAGMVDWFPALTGRRNVTTWQGTEWVADGYTRQEAVAIADCRSAACLPDVDYYVLRPGCCESLAADLDLVRAGVYRR